MIEQKFIKANIDEKNVTSDWIFDYILDSRNDISVSTRIPSDKGNSFIGVYGNSVVNAYWETTDNKVTFKFLHTLTTTANDSDMDKLYRFLLEELNDGSLVTRVTQVDDTTIVVEFYWKEE